MNRAPAFAIAAAFATVLAAMLYAPSLDTINFQAPAILENGKGSLVDFKMTLAPGEGRLLVNIRNSFYQEDVENSLKKARSLVQKQVGKPLDGYDIIVETMQESSVGGESAGAMFTIALQSVATGREIRGDAAMSAAVTEEGSLTPVDGIDEKIAAAIDAGKTRFIVAAGQQINNEKELEKRIEIIRANDTQQAEREMLA